MASAADHIVVELFLVVLFIPTLVVASIGVPVAGLMLLLIHRFWIKKEIRILPLEWKSLIVVSALFAFTEFMWFDAIGHIGAGKTALLNLPLEPVAVVIFSFLILGEKLRRHQLIGSCIVLAGVILSIQVAPTGLLQFGIGETEAIAAALAGAIQLVLVARLLHRHDTLECTAFILILSGLMLNAFWIFSPVKINPTLDWLWTILFSFIPMILFLAYYGSTNRIGASLTSIVWASSIVLTLVLQVIIAQFGIPVRLPQNVILALAGGMISIAGIYLIFHKSNFNEKEEKRKESK